MKKILIMTAAVLVGLAGAANATTVGVLLGATPNNLSFSTTSGSYGSGGELNPNIPITTSNPQITLPFGNPPNETAAIVSGSVTNQYAQPSGPIFGSTYLAVYGPNGYYPGVASVTLATSPKENVFGFTWGSIDGKQANGVENNILSISAKNGNTVYSYQISGSEILSLIAGNTQADVIVKDPVGYIISATFLANHNSFEVANFEEAAVPLPSSIGMLLIALGGLYFLRRKQII